MRNTKKWPQVCFFFTYFFFLLLTNFSIDNDGAAVATSTATTATAPPLPRCKRSEGFPANRPHPHPSLAANASRRGYLLCSTTTTITTIPPSLQTRVGGDFHSSTANRPHSHPSLGGDNRNGPKRRIWRRLGH